MESRWPACPVNFFNEAQLIEGNDEHTTNANGTISSHKLKEVT